MSSLEGALHFPVGRGKAILGDMSRVLEAVLGGWKTSAIWRISAGRPLVMTLADGTSLPTYGAQRPNIVGTPKRNNGPDFIDSYFADPTVFQLPDIYALGNAPRAIGSVRSPTSFTADMAIGKLFSLASVHEGMNLEFKLEAQNVFNHPVFGTPNTAVDDPSFGSISYTSNQPRQVQMSLRVIPTEDFPLLVPKKKNHKLRNVLAASMSWRA